MRGLVMESTSVNQSVAILGAFISIVSASVQRLAKSTNLPIIAFILRRLIDCRLVIRRGDTRTSSSSSSSTKCTTENSVVRLRHSNSRPSTKIGVIRLKFFRSILLIHISSFPF